MGLQAAICDLENMRRAWIETSDASRGVAKLRSTIYDYEMNLGDRLNALSEDLASGRWNPKPLQRVNIRKPNGEWRPLRIPPFEDRLVERAIGQVITGVVDPELSPWSFAYRRGISVDDAVHAVKWLRDQNRPIAVRVDIDDCFDTITPDLARRRLGSFITDPWLDATVLRLLGRGEQRNRTHQLPRQAWGVPQGAPLSPLMANIVLDEFDNAMAGAGYPTVRFADDMCITAPDVETAKQALDAANQALEPLGLALNKGKTKVTTFEDGFAFLGQELGPATLEDELRALEKFRKNDRRAVYIQTQGAYCSYRSGQLRVTKNKEEILSLPISLVGPLVVSGAVTLSSGLRNALLFNDIELIIQSRRGRYLGRLDTGRNDARLIRQQYQQSTTAEQRARLAKPIVAGKIANMRALLLRYNRRENLPHLHGATNALRESYRSLRNYRVLDEILGSEGNASRIYFGALKHLMPTWTEFDGRNRRPPRDPANAALSYGYALLLGETVAACRAAGLDPSCGYLHADDRKRPSLALDLMEEFRPVVVDTTVIELFRRNQLQPTDFDSTNESVLLNNHGRRTLIEAFEKRMITEFAHVPSGRRTTYRRSILLQAQQVVTTLRDESANYTPVPWR